MKEIYTWIDTHGNEIFEGFDSSIDLVLYNHSYEFLISNKQYSDWERSNSNIMGKNVYIRKAEKPRAFAVKIGDSWAGSFSTADYFPISLIEQIPIVIPPQLFMQDEIAYRSAVVHEMIHAYQGKCDYNCVDKAEHIQNVNSNYHNQKEYDDLICQEGSLLQKAITADSSELKGIVNEFLNTRDKRYESCGMSQTDIDNEKEFEWLEGCARYAEYIAIQGSNSLSAKSLGNIKDKVKEKSDDRYYTLGMAQIQIIKRLSIPNWNEELLFRNATPEQLLREYVNEN